MGQSIKNVDCHASFPMFSIIGCCCCCCCWLQQPSLTSVFWKSTDLVSQQCFRECVRWISPTCNSIQTSRGQTPPDSATTSYVTTNIWNVHRFHVFSTNTPCYWHATVELYWNLGHPILTMWLNSQTRARFSEHSGVLAQLLRFVTANMTCVATNVSLFSRSPLSCSSFQTNLQPNQNPHAPPTLHLTNVVQYRQHASPCMSTPWLFHACETLTCFDNVNSLLNDRPQLNHWAVVDNDSADGKFSEFSICAVCSSNLLTRGESKLFSLSTENNTV